MSLAYVRQYYGVPAYHGTPVLYTGDEVPRRGVIMSATDLIDLRVRWDDDPTGPRGILNPVDDIQYGERP